MGYVYLIGEEENKDQYKIGCTKKNPEKRIEELQTGNPNKLILKAYFETDRPYRLETMLHNRYKEYNTLNEWYYIEKDAKNEFIKTCNELQEIINSLKDNPYF